MTPSVGADIESICRKCGDVWHVVVAKVGDKIARVQCKQCNGQHRYKPPPGVKSASSRNASSARTGSPRKARQTARQRARPQVVSARIDEPQVQANTSKPIRAYKASDTYDPGDRIDHPKFGHGVVEVTSEPGKMQVFFPDGRRILALARKQSSSLQRPRPFSHETPKKAPKW